MYLYKMLARYKTGCLLKHELQLNHAAMQNLFSSWTLLSGLLPQLNLLKTSRYEK